MARINPTRTAAFLIVFLLFSLGFLWFKTPRKQKENQKKTKENQKKRKPPRPSVVGFLLLLDLWVYIVLLSFFVIRALTCDQE
jgi:ABC-type Fe3+ transport system permease subunit